MIQEQKVLVRMWQTMDGYDDMVDTEERGLLPCTPVDEVVPKHTQVIPRGLHSHRIYPTETRCCCTHLDDDTCLTATQTHIQCAYLATTSKCGLTNHKMASSLRYESNKRMIDHIEVAEILQAWMHKQMGGAWTKHVISQNILFMFWSCFHKTKVNNTPQMFITCWREFVNHLDKLYLLCFRLTW